MEQIPFIDDLGVSENSVPHCTQWLMIIIPIKMAISLGIYPTFSDKPIYLFKAVILFLAPPRSVPGAQ